MSRLSGDARSNLSYVHIAVDFVAIRGLQFLDKGRAVGEGWLAIWLPKIGAFYLIVIVKTSTAISIRLELPFGGF